MVSTDGNLSNGLEVMAWAGAPPPDEFPNMLQAAQAPPGPEPPPTQAQTSGVEEQQTNEANAQSEKPDLSSQTEKTDDSSKDDSTKKVKKGSSSTSDAAIALPGISLALPESKAVSTTPPPSAPTSTHAVVGTADKGQPIAGQDKVSLSQLPVDPVANIVSASAGVEVGTGQANAGIQAPDPTIPVVPPVDPAALAAVDLASADAAPAEPAGPVVTMPQAVADFTVQAGQTQGLTSPTSTTTPNPDAHGVQAAKPDSDPVTSLAAQGQASSGQTGNGQSTGANGQGAGNQSQNADVIRQISEHSDKMALKSASENVTVHLQTEDDTNVTMMVKSARGEVQAQFVTNNEALRNALHQNRPQLAQTLETKGLNLGQVSVGFKNSSTRQDQPGRRPTQGGAAASLAPTHSKESGRMSSNPLLAGVDIWI